jgi:hypothetical protein
MQNAGITSETLITVILYYALLLLHYNNHMDFSFQVSS